MTANELKIGNYVNVPNEAQCPFRIDAFEYLSKDFIKVAMKMTIEGTEVHPLTWYGGDLTPIELTPEWLNKTELQKLGTRNMWNKGKFSIYYQESPDAYSQLCKGNFYFVTLDVEKNVAVTHFQIKYIHQLQNLYFALQNEELTFKFND